MTLIRVDNITKYYNNGDVKTKALDGVSFKIEKGEFVSIVGPSGSGKSTLMHILGALDLPTSGSYTLNGKSVEKMSDDELSEIRNKEIGFVFQAYNLLSRVSSLSNVVLPMSYGGISKSKRIQIATELLQKVGLDKKLNNKPNQLSGGEKQRVAIARALSMNPSILLADEPTGNLPTSQSDEILGIFEELNEQGNTVLVITHDPDIAKRAKRMISLVDGKIVKDEKIKK